MDNFYEQLLNVAQEIEIGHAEILPGGIGEADEIARNNGVGILQSEFFSNYFKNFIILFSIRNFSTYLDSNGEIPHGLFLEDIEEINHILQEDPHLAPAFRVMFQGHLNDNSHTSYDWVLRDLRGFCLANGNIKISF